MKVTMIEEGELPSQTLVRAAASEATVTDSAGRVITLKKPGVLAQFKLIEMLGGTAASNSVFVTMVLPLIYVTAVDGDPISRITKRAELDALIQRLDDDGVEAVMRGVSESFGQRDPEAEKAALKN
jgi:hypothetical protein